MTTTIAPARAPRRGARVVLATTLAAASLAVPILLRPGTAGAEELSRFTSCAQLREFLARSAGSGVGLAGDDAVTAQRGALSAEAAAPPAAAPAGAAAGGTGTTNVQVAGVDELDVTDTDGSLILVVGDGGGARGEPDGQAASVLRLVDPSSGQVRASLDLPGFGHTLTWDAPRGVAWLVGSEVSVDRGVTRLSRVAVSARSLALDGSTTIAGSLVGARRVEGRLHLVATDGPTFGIVARPLPMVGLALPGVAPG
ncbi:MAG: beta-propeller domain-containing protein, partial [Acidimicrobiales bacterium]